MPRLSCSYRRFIEIIEANGFVLHRHGATSHRRQRSMAGGDVHLVDVAYHSIGGDIPIGTLTSMIRQSGLDKALFVK